MVFTRKFSEFPPGTLDQNVGLEGDVNTRGPSGGGGGGMQGVTQTFPQQSPPVTLGHWVRVTPGSGLYTDAKGDDAMDAEVIGVVINSNALTFTLQQSGYITSAQDVFSGLTIGNPYFLDTLTLGQMVLNDATINGTVSRPVFVADSASSGWVLPYRGLIVGQGLPNSTGGEGTDSSIVTISQSNSFIPGDVVRVNTPAIGGAVTYVLAQANSLANSQAVGIVCLTPPPTPTQFTLQFSGYNIGAVTKDDMGVDVVGSNVLYLSANFAGKLTTINPILAGQYSKPMYVVEQGTANLGINAGYILPQRPLIETLAPVDSSIHTVEQLNSFDANGGQWLYIDADGHYSLAFADTLAHAQVAGVTISANSASFVIQQSGWVFGTVTGSHVDGSLTSAMVYYLSNVTMGNITSVVPTVGQISKPCYVQETATGNVGEILPQRPLILTASGSDPTLHVVSQAGNGFNLGDWLYISADNVYTRGIATSLATSQVVGVVTVPGDPLFTIQTNGYNTGAVFGDPGLAPSVVMYLSTTAPGRLQAVAPSVVGQFTKPCYIQEHAADFTGDILEQRPLVNVAPGGGGGDVLITSIVLNGQTSVPLIGLFDGTYDDIRIVGENIIFQHIPSSNFFATGFRVQLEYNNEGVVRTDGNYVTFANRDLGVGTTGTQTQFVGTQFGGGPTNTIQTSGGLCYYFEMSLLGITDTVTLKPYLIDSRSWQDATVGFPIYNQLMSLYKTSLLSITGLSFSFVIAQYRMTHGTISVYGTAS